MVDDHDGAPDEPVENDDPTDLDEPVDQVDPADAVESDHPGEQRYRRRIGITLAVLALLGAWIAVLQTNASTNESRTTREATRLAAEAQTARVIDRGVQAGLEQVEAETDVFVLRDAFNISPSAASAAGAPLDPAREQARVEAGQALVTGALQGDGTRATGISERARHLTLEQSAVVEQRITWNARASQYETVLTTLAIAIFLIGFTMVVGPKIRPPFVGPGLLLAVFCFGWAVHIYLKPIPEIDLDAVTSTAAGQVALAEGRSDDAVADFDAAIDIDDTYAPAFEGRGLARLVVANPDLLTSLAITDQSTQVVDAAVADLDRAFELGAPKDAAAVSIAALARIVGEDWDRAATLLEDASEQQNRTPGLELWRSAIAVAQDDQATAAEWLERAADQMTATRGTDTNRALAAQYLTLLEFVADSEPSRAELATRFVSESIALIAVATGSDPSEAATSDATLQIVQAEFADGVTTVELARTGVPAGTPVVLAGYERPAPGASWVQPAALFYAGPIGDGGSLEVPTPQVCAPVEFRFDLYVNGVLTDSATSPGGRPTC